MTPQASLRFHETLSPRLCIREVRAAYLSVQEFDGSPITDPEIIARPLMALFETETDPQENLLAVYLDSRHRVISTCRVYRGTVNATTVGTRDILVGALLQGSPAVIIAHNHPGGDPSPSAEDLLFTRKLVLASESLDIRILDHVILGAGRYVSLKKRGIL